MLRTTVISAPGKVLIAGGYLVLDPAYSGVVVSTSSRFYTALRDEPSLKPNTIRVRSPQFIDATWQYSAVLEPSVLIEPFGEKCVVQYRIILYCIFSHPLIVPAKMDLYTSHFNILFPSLSRSRVSRRFARSFPGHSISRSSETMIFIRKVQE